MHEKKILLHVRLLSDIRKWLENLIEQNDPHAISSTAWNAGQRFAVVRQLSIEENQEKKVKHEFEVKLFYESWKSWSNRNETFFL